MSSDCSEEAHMLESTSHPGGPLSEIDVIISLEGTQLCALGTAHNMEKGKEILANPQLKDENASIILIQQLQI